jgi:hypothetical protein
MCFKVWEGGFEDGSEMLGKGVATFSRHNMYTYNCGCRKDGEVAL